MLSVMRNMYHEKFHESAGNSYICKSDKYIGIRTCIVVATGDNMNIEGKGLMVPCVIKTP